MRIYTVQTVKATTLTSALLAGGDSVQNTHALLLEFVNRQTAHSTLPQAATGRLKTAASATFATLDTPRKQMELASNALRVTNIAKSALLNRVDLNAMIVWRDMASIMIQENARNVLAVIL